MVTNTRMGLTAVGCGVLVLLALGTGVGVAQDRDLDAPRIINVSFDNPVAGQSFNFRVKVEDASGIKEVALYIHRTEADQFQRIDMRHTESDMYEASVPAESVQRPRLRYYIVVSDEFGNQRWRGSQNSVLSLAVADPPLEIASESEYMPKTRAAPSGTPNDVAAATDMVPEPKTNAWKWVMRVLAVSAVAALAIGSGSSGDVAASGAPTPPPTTGNVTLTDIPAPQ